MLYSDEYSKLVSVPTQVLKSSHDGHVKHMSDTFTVTAALATTDEISFGILPAKAKIIECIVEWTDLSSGTGAMDIGYTGALTALHTGLDVTAAGIAKFGSTTAPIVLTADKELIASFSAACEATSGTIKITVIYCI